MLLLLLLLLLPPLPLLLLAFKLLHDACQMQQQQLLHIMPCHC
jgi:hypothetical protein